MMSKEMIQILVAAIVIPLMFMLYMDIKQKLFGKKPKKRRNKKK